MTYTKFTCRVCGAKVNWYRGVGVNRVPTRICEHKDPKTGKKCPNSRKPLGEATVECHK